jgi:hypothetical protein
MSTIIIIILTILAALAAIWLYKQIIYMNRGW